MRACFCFRLRKKHSIVLLFTNIFHFIFKDFLCLFSLANDLVTHTFRFFTLRKSAVYDIIFAKTGI